MHKACFLGFLDIIELLLSKGANPFLAGEHCGTIRDVAVVNSHTLIIEFLDSTFISRLNPDIRRTMLATSAGNLSTRFDAFSVLDILESRRRSESQDKVELIPYESIDLSSTDDLMETIEYNPVVVEEKPVQPASTFSPIKRTTSVLSLQHVHFSSQHGTSNCP